MDIHRSEVTIGLIVVILFSSLTSCKTSRQSFYRYNKENFSQIEIRYGEGKNEKCALLLTSEGLIIRESMSFNEAENVYHFVPIIEIDSLKLSELQNLVRENHFLSEWENRDSLLLSGFANSRITTVWNPISQTSVSIRDSNYYDRAEYDDEVLLDQIWGAMIELIPDNYLRKSICWQGWGDTWGRLGN